MTKESKGGNADFETLVIQDTSYKTLLTDKFKNRVAWQKPNERLISSYLPGTILAVKVKKGEKIKAGQVIMTFEAMKMINTVKSPVDGTVKNIYVEEGQKVSKNFLMFEIE